MKKTRVRLTITCILGFILIFPLSACNRNTGPVNGMYRILTDKKITKVSNAGEPLPVYRIVRGQNLVFSYNDITLPGNKEGRKMQSESIVFEVPADSERFDLKGTSLDSSYAYYMVSDSTFRQFPVKNGYIKGVKLKKGVWQVNLSIQIAVDTGKVVKTINHDFSIAPAIQQGASD